MTDIQLDYDYVIGEDRFALVVEPEPSSEFTALITAGDGGYLKKSQSDYGLQRVHITTVSEAARDQFMVKIAEVIIPVAGTSYDIQSYEKGGVYHGWIFWFQEDEDGSD
jgi:hypothetical protein